MTDTVKEENEGTVGSGAKRTLQGGSFTRFLLVFFETLAASHSLALPFAESLHPLYPALPSCKVLATSSFMMYFVFIFYPSPPLHFSATKAKNSIPLAASLSSLIPSTQ